MKRLLFAWSALLLCYSGAFAHAHIFVDYKLHALVNDSLFEGFFVNWSFDPMFSASIKEEYDSDANGTLSKAEQLEVYKHSFRDWKRGDYFGFLRLNGESHPFPIATKFSARFLDGNRIAFSFFVPLNLPLSEAPQELGVTFMDEVFYVDFGIEAKDITTKNRAPQSVQLQHRIDTVEYIPEVLFTVQKGTAQ